MRRALGDSSFGLSAALAPQERAARRSAAALAVAFVAVLAGGGCSKVADTRVTDWCMRRSTVGPSSGVWSGSRSSECRVRSWGLWWKLDEVAVGPVIALDRDTVLISVPGRRKLIRRGERQARAVCGNDEYGALPPGHDAIDCLGFVAGPAIGVPTAVRFQRLDIQGRPVGEAAVIHADRGTAPEGAAPITGGAVESHVGAAIPEPEAQRRTPRRVFAALAISWYDDARTPYFVTYNDRDLVHPACVLLEWTGDTVRAHPAAPGTSLADCSGRDAWSRVVGRMLYAPE